MTNKKIEKEMQEDRDKIGEEIFFEKHKGIATMKQKQNAKKYLESKNTLEVKK